MEFTVRTATPSDFDAVLALWSEADYHTSVPDGPDTVRRFHAFSADLFLVAESDGEVIGTVLAPWNGWRGYIARLATHRARRRSGVATALIAEAERRLREKGARQVYANVDTASDVAIAFWEASEYTRFTTGVYARVATPQG